MWTSALEEEPMRSLREEARRRADGARLEQILQEPAQGFKHIVVFIQENHTFDSLFAGFPGADSEFAGQLCPDTVSPDPPHQHLDALAPNGVTLDTALVVVGIAGLHGCALLGPGFPILSVKPGPGFPTSSV